MLLRARAPRRAAHSPSLAPRKAKPPLRSETRAAASRTGVRRGRSRSGYSPHMSLRSSLRRLISFPKKLSSRIFWNIAFVSCFFVVDSACDLTSSAEAFGLLLRKVSISPWTFSFTVLIRPSPRYWRLPLISGSFIRSTAEFSTPSHACFWASGVVVVDLRVVADALFAILVVTGKSPRKKRTSRGSYRRRQAPSCVPRAQAPTRCD
ncbi:hypothetical protein MXAN_2456 [Myxococcus xanthus DK 1622]|uniref:Uncharacterized protein n=1 Tax=Myxococcus xanthus (strain DK1622) TaxID=246197 RepID=Q1D9J8_MYXXD|nr:hypothetical protein MXAN_2456 [Myxococcus xanthus DK 1622]